MQQLKHALQQTEQQQTSEMQAAQSLAEQASSAAETAAAAVEAKLGSVEAALASAQVRLQQQTHVSYKMSRERNELTKQVSRRRLLSLNASDKHCLKRPHMIFFGGPQADGWCLIAVVSSHAMRQ